MTPVQAIQSATIRAAELLQVEDRGRLAPVSWLTSSL